MKTQKIPTLILILLSSLVLCPFAQAASKVLPLSLSFSSTNSGTISVPGQQDRFTFSGTTGQWLFYDALDMDFDQVTATLYSPSGAQVFNINSSSDHGPFYLLENGVHTLVVDGSGDAVDDYSFILADLATAPTLTLGTTITNNLQPKSRALFYRYSGTAGQRLLATNIAASGSDANWILFSPAEQQVFNHNISTSPGEVVLPVSGTYLLAFVGATDTIGTTDFQSRLSLVSNPSDGTSGFGTVRSGTTALDQTNTFTYTAPAGTRIYFDALTNNSPVYVCLYDPNNEVVPGFCLSSGQNDQGPFLLPRSGTYRLEVVGQTDGGYNFRLLDLNAGATALTYGTTYTQTLTSGFRTDVYRFTGATGQRIYYDALDPDSDTVFVRIVHPNGNVALVGNGNASSDHGVFTIDEPGTYWVMLEGYADDNTLDYSFRLIEMGQSPAAALTLDTTVNGILNPGTEVDWYRFNGTAGQRLFFDGNTTNTAGTWYLYTPNNQYINAAGLAGYFEQVLPQTGTYLVAVYFGNDTNALPYSFRVTTPDSVTNALVLGTTYSGVIAQAADEVRYTFTATAGMRMHYDALDTDSDGLSVTLLNPAGNSIHISHNAESDVGPFRLTDGGSYTLVVRGQAQATGTFRFRLIDLESAPSQVIPFDTTVTAALDPGTEVDWYRFNGTAGQQLYFEAASTNGGGSWNLFGPNEQYQTGNGLAADFEHVLPSSGTYLVAVTYSVTNAHPYSIRIVTSSTFTNAYVLGTSITNNVSEPGEEHRYTFNGTAGQRLFYDGLEADSDPISVGLIDPYGNVMFLSGNADSDFGLFTLLHSGTYTILIKGSGDATGDFRFRLLDLASAPVITYGAVTSGQLNPQIEADLFRINGTAGQRLNITNIAASGNNASWYLVSPNNSVVLGQNVSAHLGEYVLPANGTYAIVIAGASDLIGTLDYQFRVSLMSSSNGTPAGFGVVRSGTTTAGQTNTYTYTGTAGLPVYFDYLTNVYVACYQLLAANGDQVFYLCNSSDSAAIYFLPTNGTYTLNVLGQADGDFRFQLQNLASATTSNLTFGTTYTRTLNPGFRTDAYRFTGANGQRLVYDSLEYEFDGVSVRLYSPSGNNIVLNGNADSETSPFTISEPGTHYLIFEGGEVENTADYSFRVIDVAQAPATALTLNTVVNGNLNPGTRSDVYRFTGTAGQRVYVVGNATNGPGSKVLYGPADQYLGGGALLYDFEATLPITGQYVLVAGSGNDTNPSPYSIRVLTITDTTNAITLGATVTGTVSSLGGSHSFTFTGTTGQRLYYDALDYDFDGINVRLLSPTGINVLEHNSDSEGAPVTLPQNGTYTLQIYFAGSTGDFAFRLLNGDVAPVLAYDTVITNSLTNAFSAALYRLPTMPNLRLYFDHLGPSDGNAGYSAYDALNASFGGITMGNDSEITPIMLGQHFVVLNSIAASPIPYGFQIVPGNHAPVLGLVGNPTINEESNLTFTATTTDLELPNDVLTWSLDAGAPAGASINPTTGVFSWTPAEVQGSNTYTVTIRVRDDGTPSFEDFETFTIRVNEVNKPPTLQLPATQTINELTALNVTVGANDSDVPTNTLTFALVSGPSGVNVAANGAITWTPTEAQGPGTYPITVRVTDFNPLAVNATSLSVTGTFNVVVNEINVPPTFTGPGNLTLVEETPLNATATANDTDVPSNPLTFTLISGPSGLSVAANGVISWTPTEAQGSNVHSVSIRVTDNNTNAVNAQQLSATNTFNITVLESNKPPMLTVPGTQTITEETPLNASASATDPDAPANPLAFSLVSAPVGLTINSSSGVLSWTPNEAQGSNSYVITVVVTDTNVLAINAISISVTNTFTIIVNESNRPPVLNSPGPQTVTEETLLNVTITGTDPDLPANGLTFGLLSPPAGMTINPSSGLISWTPNEAQGPSNHVITITLTDTNAPAVNTKSFTVTNTFTVNVLESNKAPVLTLPANQTVPELVALSLTATATDSDLPTNALTFALVAGPPGLTVSSAGAIDWLPGEADGPSSNSVSVRVFDNGTPSLSHTQTFQIVVNEVNVAPVLTVPPNTNIFTSAPYSATATATDADLPSNALTFALISPPAGMTINPGSGLISWTPTEEQGPATNIIRVSVTDTNPPAINANSFSVTNSYTIRVIKLCTLVITNQPLSRAAVTGSTAGFSVGATTAAGQTNYQWQFNGTNLFGQTARTLTISNLQSSGFGIYRVVVNDGTCSVTSNPAMLTLAVSPVFTNLQTSGTTLITSFATEFGPTYVVERKQDLGAPGWTLVSTYVGDGSPKTFTRPTQPLVQEYFRIRLE